jgi:hypothetical protein
MNKSLAIFKNEFAKNYLPKHSYLRLRNTDQSYGLLMYKSSDNSNPFDSNTLFPATHSQCTHSNTNTPLIAI